VGVVGERGSGKSTLINSIIGAEILPVAYDDTCTASLAEVSGWGRQDCCRLIIAFADYRKFFKNIATKRDGHEDEMWDDILIQVTALNGGEQPKITNSCNLDDWIPSDVLELLDKRFIIRQFSWANDKLELVEFISSFLSKNGQFWPIVSRIEIIGPFQFLIDNKITLVDIPGRESINPLIRSRHDEALGSYCNIYFYLPGQSNLTNPQCLDEYLQHLESGLIGVVVMKAFERLTHYFSKLFKPAANPFDLVKVPDAETAYRKALCKKAIKRQNFIEQLRIYLVERTYDRDDDGVHLAQQLLERLLLDVQKELIKAHNQCIIECIDSANAIISSLNQKYSAHVVNDDVTTSLRVILDNLRDHVDVKPNSAPETRPILPESFIDAHYTKLRALFKHSTADYCEYKDLQLSAWLLDECVSW
jgi:GTPase SAR1 family protein